jgi:hypothetical protein
LDFVLLYSTLLYSKFKVSRGGGRHFSRDITAIDHEMETLGLEDGNAGGSSAKQQEPEMTRAERKALKKAQGGKKKGVPAVGDLPENSDEESEEEPLELPKPGPSRRERYVVGLCSSPLSS